MRHFVALVTHQKKEGSKEEYKEQKQLDCYQAKALCRSNNII